MNIILMCLIFICAVSAHGHQSSSRHCVRYDKHHHCVTWSDSHAQTRRVYSRPSVQVRVGVVPTPPPVYIDPSYGYDPYAQGYGYDPYAYSQYPAQYSQQYQQYPPQYAQLYPTQYAQYGQYQPQYNPYGQQILYNQEMMIQQTEAARLARQLWEADRRAEVYRAEATRLAAQVQAQRSEAQAASLQAQLNQVKRQLQEAIDQAEATRVQIAQLEEIVFADDPVPAGQGE